MQQVEKQVRTSISEKTSPEHSLNDDASPYDVRISAHCKSPDRSKAVLLLWIIYVISVLFLCFRVCLFINLLWSPAGKGLTSWLSFVVSNCEVVTFPLVS